MTDKKGMATRFFTWFTFYYTWALFCSLAFVFAVVNTWGVLIEVPSGSSKHLFKYDENKICVCIKIEFIVIWKLNKKFIFIKCVFLNTISLSRVHTFTMSLPYGKC